MKGFIWIHVHVWAVYTFLNFVYRHFSAMRRPNIACATDKPVVSGGGNLMNSPHSPISLTTFSHAPSQFWTRAALRDGEQSLQTMQYTPNMYGYLFAFESLSRVVYWWSKGCSRFITITSDKYKISGYETSRSTWTGWLRRIAQKLPFAHMGAQVSP